jgi:hypothetical protein
VAELVAELEGAVEEVAEGGGGGEGRSGAARDVEGRVGLRVGGRGCGMLGAERLLDHAAAVDLAGVGGELGEDEKALTADGAADVGRESGL